MYGPRWSFLLMYSHDMRHRFSMGWRVVNGPPGLGRHYINHAYADKIYIHTTCYLFMEIT